MKLLFWISLLFKLFIPALKRWLIGNCGWQNTLFRMMKNWFWNNSCWWWRCVYCIGTCGSRHRVSDDVRCCSSGIAVLKFETLSACVGDDDIGYPKNILSDAFSGPSCLFFLFFFLLCSPPTSLYLHSTSSFCSAYQTTDVIRGSVISVSRTLTTRLWSSHLIILYMSQHTWISFETKKSMQTFVRNSCNGSAQMTRFPNRSVTIWINLPWLSLLTFTWENIPATFSTWGCIKRVFSTNVRGKEWSTF